MGQAGPCSESGLQQAESTAAVGEEGPGLVDGNEMGGTGGCLGVAGGGSY